MYRKARLTNGLSLVTCSMPNNQSVSLGIWIKVGGRYESAFNKGISHYMEHLVFKGTKKYSCREIKESIEGVGGSLNGFTSEELTCYLVKMPSRYIDLALNVLSDMVINPTIPQVEVEKERTVIMEEIKMYRDLPQSYVYELLDELLWPDQPLGMTIAGTIESVGRIKRDDLASFKARYYNPQNIIVSCVGRLEHARFLNKVKKIFSPLETRDAGKFLPVIEEQGKAQFKLFAKETEQTHLALGFHGLRRDHPLRHALALAHIILGANMSSRLFDELREKRGLAYEIGTLVKRFSDTGAFIVHAGIDNRKVTEAVELILKELAKIRNKPVSADEFKRAKEFYIGQLMLALEDTLDHMLWVGESAATLDKVISLQEVIKEVNRVRRDEIQEVCAGIFKTNKINLALIGPVKDKESGLYGKLKII